MTEPDTEISCEAVKRQLDQQAEFLLLDCRETEEHELVSIPGARLLPLSELSAQYQQLDTHRDRPIVVYCHHGMRSARATTWLREQGFAQVRSMTGGIDLWSLEIDPTLTRY